jgi:hypothetical protein
VAESTAYKRGLDVEFNPFFYGVKSLEIEKDVKIAVISAEF